MLKVRLARFGSRNNPHYRIVVVDSRAKRNAKVIETLGFYNPQTNPSKIKFDTRRYSHWLSKGAVPTETVIKIGEN